MEDRLSIKAWAEEDRPREKLMYKGRSALTDAELIAILIGSGSRNESAVEVAKRILASVENDIHRLSRMSLKDLQTFKGIGEAKAISVIAALELGRRRKEKSTEPRPRITSSADAFDLLYPVLTDLDHEEFYIVLLDRANHVIDTVRISQGGVAGTVADAKLIFRSALERLASGIILAHNHPSGNLNPSQADIQLTKNLKTSGKLLEISVLDHLIVAENSFYSFADEGLI
ncbi:MAG: DNA repair protein RadC [Flavobacteriales bacterium]|nr:DNA repair protein RadC [Flavobacteriales bacterium]